LSIAKESRLLEKGEESKPGVARQCVVECEEKLKRSGKEAEKQRRK